VSTTTVLEEKVCTACGVHANEIMGEPGVEQHRELVHADPDPELHGRRASDSYDGREGDHRRIQIKRRKISTVRRCPVAIGVVRLLHDIISHLEEEDSGALVSPDVGLIVVITKPLLATFRHLLWGQALEGTTGSGRR
jgi:hypothetical protein